MKRVLVVLAIAAVVVAAPSIARADTVWGQAFLDRPSDWGFDNSLYTLTNIELRWAAGNQFSGVNPFNFSVGGWSSIGGATWGSASGPAVNLLQFNINFLTPTGGIRETSFDYYVYPMDRSGERILDDDERVLQRRLGHQSRRRRTWHAATGFRSRASVDDALRRGIGRPRVHDTPATAAVKSNSPFSS